MPAWLLLLQVPAGATLAPPVTLTAAGPRATPSVAARALSVADTGALPPVPTPVALQCLVTPKGALASCIAADGGTVTDGAVFQRRLVAQIGRPADPLLGAALERARFYRVAPPGAARGPLRTVLVRDTVGASDRSPPTPSRGVTSAAELMVAPDPAVDIADFYPLPALRHGAEVRMTATCRVLADRSLLCRDARSTVPATPANAGWRAPQFDADFARATLRVFATMRAAPRLRSGGDSVGREAELAMNWRLP